MVEKEKENCNGFNLEIPLDASGVKDFKPDLAVKVMVVDRKGKTYHTCTSLDQKGKGRAAFKFPQNPGALRIVLGPEDADEEELLGLQTINLELPAHQVVGEELRLSPIRISPFYWHWWHWWCRTFTIRGRVLCPDGSPVPGATVCAYDVDWWWWWSSKQQVGCATTDATGSFEITFTWCCGFWPWWWWKNRFWQLEPSLAKLIVPVLQRNPKLLKNIKTLSPDSKPTLSIFDRLLAEDGVLTHQPGTDVALANLDGLREQLLNRIPVVAELERLRIWPWWPWRPWWDCTPDIIFKVTQNCIGQEKIILDEGIGDARWNISTPLDVTLVVNEEACCIRVCTDLRECPEGNCMVITQACDDPVFNIGGNPGAPVAPAGFVNPGVVAVHGDRPYAGNVPISGVFGDLAGVDYYEFEWTQTPAVPESWSTMPPAAAGGFTRWYWEQVPPPGAGPEDWHPVGFSFVPIDGRNVIESREHYEANNGPGWGVTRFWVTNRDRLIRWLTKDNFPDGTYYLRVKGWNRAGNNLNNERILPLCGTEQNNGIVLTIDNRPDVDGHVPPAASDHPCGDGTIHTCTLEPDTDFIAVKIIRADVTQTNIAACGNVQIGEEDNLQVDFMAHDPDGHLAYYTLIATYGENLAVDLLGLAGAVLAPLGGGHVPAAAQVGPDYGVALAQGAVSPLWTGGALRLTVPANLAFPETCCYQLELRAYKRTIVNCNDTFLPHRNLSTYTFGVTV